MMSAPTATPALSSHRRGFTLIEAVMVIIILGIVGSALVVGIGTGTKGFVLGRSNLALAQQVQVAMQRMILELRFVALDQTNGDLDLTTSDDGMTVTFRSKRDEELHVLAKVDTEVHLDGHVLIDQVNEFAVGYEPTTGEVSITVNVAELGDFATSIYP